MKPMLNVGAGRIILPCARPAHHASVDPSIYTYPAWWNVDRNPATGIDQVVDVFRYPFPFPDNHFAGALCAHLVEHIPHAIRLRPTWRVRRARQLARAQDGWYAFFAELWRVIEPGGVIHILAPYGWSQGAITDPTHTRLIVEHTFTHSMQPDPDSPFRYDTAGLCLELANSPVFQVNPLFRDLLNGGAESADAQGQQLIRALQTQINVAYDIYAQLRVVKGAHENSH